MITRGKRAHRIETNLIGILLLLVAWAALSDFGAAAEECVDYGTMPRIVGNGDIFAARDLVVVGDRAYAACGEYGFRIADLSDPTAPELLGYAPTADYCDDVAVEGSYAFLADRGGGVLIVDVSNPAAPVAVDTVPTPDYTFGLAVAGNYAYVTQHYGGLLVVDVSDPTDAAVVGSVSLPGWLYDVVVEDGIAYVAGYHADLLVVDVSVPTAPAAIGSLSVPGYVRDVEVRGDRVYLATVSDGLHVVDVATPSSPVLLGSVDTVDEFVYIERLAVSGSYALLATGIGLQIVDVSDAQAPFLATRVGTWGAVYGVAVAGDLAYTAEDGSGITVIDVANPDLTARTGTALPSEWVTDVVVRDGLAYVASLDSGLSILDLTDPDAPATLSTIGTLSSAAYVALHGDYAAVLDYNSTLRPIDVSNPAEPESVGSYQLPDLVSGLAVDAVFAFVSVDWWGVFVIDISDPAHPQHLATASDVDMPAQIVADYPWVYVNDAWNGLRVLDVSDPWNPEVVYTNYDASGALALNGSLLYVAALDLMVFDVTDPAAPALLGSAGFPGGAERMTVAGDLLYASGNGLHLFDISDPEAPVYVGVAPTWGIARSAAVSDNRVYQAAELGGLEIFLPHCTAQSRIDEPPVRPSGLAAAIGAWPNPLAPRTSISFALAEACPVELTVHDVAGRRVATLARGRHEAGSHAVSWGAGRGGGHLLPAAGRGGEDGDEEGRADPVKPSHGCGRRCGGSGHPGEGFEDIEKTLAVISHRRTASRRTRSRIRGLRPFSVTTSTLRLRRSCRSMSMAPRSNSDRPGSMSTRKSTSLSGAASPRATEPKTRRRRAPWRAAICRISRRLLRTRASISMRRTSLRLAGWDCHLPSPRSPARAPLSQWASRPSRGVQVG